MLSDLQLVYMVPRNSTQLLKINTTKFQVEREPVYKSGITLLIFALEQKLKVHWNGLQKTFLLSYYTSKSEQAENSLVLPMLNM